MAESGISIELSQAQINRVVRETAEDDGFLGLLGGLEAIHIHPSSAQFDDPRLSRSLLRGLMILGLIAADRTARSVTDVANELGLGISTTHRYISTLVEVGLLERDPVSRQYRLTVRG
jgi:DNA-binding MarR family transcriptional regulator